MVPSKDRILDAAERVVLRDGVMHLTLDAVAAEAQMSKGGLLYHFPSKDDLIRGMIRRLQDQFEGDVKRFEAEDPDPVGRKGRAVLNACFPAEPSETAKRSDRIAAALLAAIATNRLLLDDIREYSLKQEQELLDDGLDPVQAMIIHMAAEGLWLSSLFGLGQPSGKLREQVIDRLREMTTKAYTGTTVITR
jgi:AcrR family transcriptional regulator